VRFGQADKGGLPGGDIFFRGGRTGAYPNSSITGQLEIERSGGKVGKNALTFLRSTGKIAGFLKPPRRQSLLPENRNYCLHCEVGGKDARGTCHRSCGSPKHSWFRGQIYRYRRSNCQRSTRETRTPRTYTQDQLGGAFGHPKNAGLTSGRQRRTSKLFVTAERRLIQIATLNTPATHKYKKTVPSTNQHSPGGQAPFMNGFLKRPMLQYPQRLRLGERKWFWAPRNLMVPPGL